MKKNKIFVACDSTNISKIKEIIKHTSHPKLKIGYKFGLEFLNSKNGRNFVSKLKKKIIFADLKSICLIFFFKLLNVLRGRATSTSFEQATASKQWYNT